VRGKGDGEEAWASWVKDAVGRRRGPGEGLHRGPDLAGLRSRKISGVLGSVQAQGSPEQNSAPPSLKSAAGLRKRRDLEELSRRLRTNASKKKGEKGMPL